MGLYRRLWVGWAWLEPEGVRMFMDLARQFYEVVDQVLRWVRQHQSGFLGDV